MSGVPYHVGERLLARLAARHARQVPGVVGVYPGRVPAPPDLAGPARGHPAVAGASARVDDGSAEVTIAIITRLGESCRDVAVAVQEAVGAALSRDTGLTVEVRVVITDVLLD
ncbi:Asp23/Gls24 family envelope stress response protein [Pseudonocardia hispaniensis]|uniref:Asp23/Gls24 family envelope stress response protein n=1 Tax=Pseudonocardia hispaniensis TaxID=904933 RepID=A0ABW1J7I7_9PSEU